MQPVDFTTLTAVCAELRATWIPARVEQVYQCDRHTLLLALRTVKQRGWLTLCWHPQAARLCLGEPPPRDPDTFTFSAQLRHQLKGLALVALPLIAPWERVVDLQFARRPDDPIRWHLYVEVMGKFSNVILTDARQQIIAPAHQVSTKQSSLRPLLTGKTYQPPPPLSGYIPNLQEPQIQWQDRVALLPGPLQRQLLQCYRGLSPAVVRSLCQAAALDPEQSTASLTPHDWQQLFQRWQGWLQAIAAKDFYPSWTKTGYSVLAWEQAESVASVHVLLHQYYTRQLEQQNFVQLRHQLRQTLTRRLQKRRRKADRFATRLAEADEASQPRKQADLLMANLPAWRVGMTAIVLADFVSGEPITIALQPEKNAVQNAQMLYRRHQKLKRAHDAIVPLLQQVHQEIDYLEQVAESLSQLATYGNHDDWQTLVEIHEELMEQHYVKPLADSRPRKTKTTPPLKYLTPSGFEVWIGRNNRQNDQLTFRLATDYDLWFHAQEIPGSHVLLRLPPGAVAQEGDLQCAADLAAYFSRARQSQQVPVVYTQPQHVYKPKGASPGMAIYQKEQLQWGFPQAATPMVQRNTN